MTPDQIREAYLSFFEARGHARLPSDRLVPENDPTLLFTGAGMNQFKAMFLGRGNLPHRRVTTAQKCLRMPDLENVGRTPSHHTFFEMLGNFSFGDYFKEDAIVWAWELLASWGIPGDRLSVTVYQDDDEAAAIWADRVGVPRARIFRRGEEDNFWPASAPSQGPNGICGPCSEIYFDFYPERGAYPPGGSPDDARRFVEIWNLVFTQFDRHEGGLLAPLPSKNIDTGMGFERVVRVIESLRSGRVLASNFDTELFRPLLEAIHEAIGRTTIFGTPEGERVRRIADHVRAASFCIADGVRPGNERQGYVVRKVLRRAMIDRHVLGGDLRQPWLARLSEVVAQSLGQAWPELADARQVVAATIAGEEEKFAEGFFSASQRLAVMVEEATRAGQSRLPGEQAFLLYDTFGLPLDLQQMLLSEQGLEVDEEGYRQALAAQRRRSRESSRISDKIFDEGPLAGVAAALPATEFVRSALDLPAQLLAVVDEPGERGGEAESGLQRRVVLVLDRTPFYAEGGGQVGDCGWIESLEGPPFRVEVDDTLALRGIHVHRGVVVEGVPRPGACRAIVDAAARAATARHHTATHLLHAALRSVLGDEATQAGSLVAPDRLRFDFRFPRALTAEELRAIEDQVNAWTLANRDVGSQQMPRAEARALGAMALFGEKYGETVRVVRVDHFARGTHSLELCGGTHVQRSGDIGAFVITSEGSVAAGIRRVEAVTGLAAVERLHILEGLLRRSSALVKTSPDHLEERIGALQAELRESRRELEELRGRTVQEQLSAACREWQGLRVVLAVLQDVPAKALRESVSKTPADLALVATREAEGTAFLVSAGPRAQAQGLHADTLVRALGTLLSGRGGGNKAFAQGRGTTVEGVEAALEAALQGAATANR